MGTGQPIDVHDLDPSAFLEEVHSFEFWFQAVEGYLSGHDVRASARRAATRRSSAADRERLITVLCNYCVGETAALEGASGLIAIAPNRLAKVFLSTQVADEGRHLEVFLHRLRELGVADPEREIERRASREPAALPAPAARAGREQGLGGGDLRAERDPRVARVRGLPRPRRRTPTRSRPRCCAASSRTSAATSASARTSSGGGSRRRRTSARASGRSKKELDHLVLDALEETTRRIGVDRATSSERLGRTYLESVERLGFA